MTSRTLRAGLLIAAAAVATSGTLALAGPATAATPACGNSSLALTDTPSQGATGHGSLVLLYRNYTHSSCTLYGYPGLDAINSSGHVLAHATRTLKGFAGGPGVEKTITLAPGGYASAIVEWMNFNPQTSGSCTFSSAINTTAANTTHVVKLPGSVSVCDLQVHPTQAGTNGYWDYALAQTAWQEGANVSAAAQGSYWGKAKAALATQGSEYATQVSQLAQLIAMPDTGLTSAQIAKVKALVSALDTFFCSPSLYH